MHGKTWLQSAVCLAIIFKTAAISETDVFFIHCVPLAHHRDRQWTPDIGDTQSQ